MRNIIVVDNYDTRNNGVMAMGISFVQKVSEYFDNPKVSFYSFFKEVDSARYRDYGVRVNSMFWKSKLRPGKFFDIIWFLALSLLAMVGKFIPFVKFRNSIDPFRETDAIVSLCGEDLYSDHCSWQLVLYELFPFVMAKIFNKPYVIFAQTLGPFTKKRSKFLLKHVIGNASLVLIREKVSFDMVIDMVPEKKSRIVLTGDSAFFLKPIELFVAQELVKKDLNKDIYNKNVIGISVSQLFTQSIFPVINSREHKYESFVDSIAKISDFLCEQLNVNILFVPHVTVPHNDDRKIAFDILNKVKTRDSVFALKHEYKADQIKGMIHACDSFVGCRMHSLVAAVSGNIPTLALAYSYKTVGVIGPIVGDKLLVDVRSASPQELVAKVIDGMLYLYDNKSEVIRTITINMEKQFKVSLKNFELLKGLVNKECVNR
ncbi:MAG: polysaccharide pyruvyl transferase family protein [Candidatus Omnitrophica bacterium]|nr:polysaccharide pyruvyl transferase family protein [Candidatus Omnitrophota bacterium]